MLIIYGSDISSPANKVRFVANYLNLQYEYKRLDLRSGEHRNPEMIKLNPIGKVPFINDDGFVLAESGPIIKYLAEKEGSSIYPKELKKRALIDQDIDFVTLHVGMAIQKIVFNRVFAQRLNIPVDQNSLTEGQTFLARFLPVVEQKLSQNTYVSGNEVTLTDFTLLSFLDPSELAGIDLSLYPHLKQWRANLREQEFYTKCYEEHGEMLKQPAKN